MAAMPRLNLRNKLLLFAVVIAIIPLLIAGQSLVRIARDEMKSSANDQLVGTARQITDEIDDLYQHAWLAPIQLIRNAVDDDTLGPEEKIALLRHGIADLPDVVALQITIVGSKISPVATQDQFSEVLKQAGLDPAAVPTDKESYLKSLDALKAAGVQGDWVDGYVFTGTFEFESLLWQFGGSPYNKDVSQATFNSDAGVQALTWMTDLVKNGYSPAKVAQDGNFNALLAGKNAFNWNGVWQTTNNAFPKIEWAAAPVPQIGSEKAVWSSSTHWIFMNNKGQDKNKTAAAATFVKWMNDNSAGWAATGELPADNKVRNDPSLLTTYPNLKPFLDELPYARYETVSPGINAANATITTAVNDAVLGKKSPKQALDDAAAQANQLLKQNKSQYGG